MNHDDGSEQMANRLKACEELCEWLQGRLRAARAERNELRLQLDLALRVRRMTHGEVDLSNRKMQAAGTSTTTKYNDTIL